MAPEQGRGRAWLMRSERCRGSDHLGPAGGSLAFPLGEMGATEGLEERSDVTRLNALASVFTLASVWRMENRGNARTKMTSSEAITRREMMTVSSKVVAVAGRGVVGCILKVSGCILKVELAGFDTVPDGRYQKKRRQR